MERWSGKVALVTGASSGIGAAITIDLVKSGMIVVGAARRQERVDQLCEQLSPSQRTNLHSIRCDVTNEADIKNTFEWIEKNLGGVDVLINNAGTTRAMNLVDADNSADVRNIIDTNLTGAIFCCREAFQSMKKRNVAGHIVLINSIVGHNIPSIGAINASFHVYAPTKYAITAMTEVLRQECQMLDTKIKISSVSPGLVLTEIIPPEYWPVMKDFPKLESQDISDGVLYVLGTPPHVQIHELTIKPLGEKF